MKPVKTVVFSFMLCFFFAGAAFAGLEVCNQSHSRLVNVAIGYLHHGRKVSEGWWTIERGECKTVIGRPLYGYYYFYAFSRSGKKQWTGNYSFCTLPEAFKLHNADTCEEGGDMMPFEEIDARRTANHIQNLTE